MAKKKFGLDIEERNIVPITAVEDPFSIQIYAEIICWYNIVNTSLIFYLLSVIITLNSNYLICQRKKIIHTFKLQSIVYLL